MVQLCLSPAVMAQGSVCPHNLGRGSGGQERAWQRGELTTVGCLGIKTATKFWGVRRAGPRAEHTRASDELPTFLQPCVGGDGWPLLS